MVSSATSRSQPDMSGLNQGLLDTLAKLCHEPFATAKPQVFRGGVEDPEGLFGEAHIQRMLANPAFVSRTGLFRDQNLIDPAEHPDAYTHEGVERYRRKGVSITLRGIQRQPGHVRVICTALRDTGWATVHAVALETPPDVQALATHWDLNPVIAIQTKGSKTWHTYEPTVKSAEEVITAWYERNYGAGFTEAQRSRLTPEYAADTVTLEPGDVYFVPAGWPHAPFGAGVQSLHVSICPLPQVVYERSGNEDHQL